MTPTRTQTPSLRAALDAGRSVLSVLEKTLLVAISGYGSKANGSQNGTRQEPLPTVALDVCLQLLTRMSRDLVCAIELASEGYPIQAATLISSVFEAAYTTAYVGDDTQRAMTWLQHRDPTKPFMPIRDVIDMALRPLNLPGHAKVVDNHFSTYGQLCMSRRVDPLLERQIAIHEQAGSWVLDSRPDFSDEASQLSEFTLSHATQAAGVAITATLRNHVPRERAHTLWHEWNLVERRLQTQSQPAMSSALSRGWSQSSHTPSWRR